MHFATIFFALLAATSALAAPVSASSEQYIQRRAGPQPLPNPIPHPQPRRKTSQELGPRPPTPPAPPPSPEPQANGHRAQARPGGASRKIRGHRKRSSDALDYRKHGQPAPAPPSPPPPNTPEPLVNGHRAQARVGGVSKARQARSGASTRGAVRVTTRHGTRLAAK